MAVSVLILLAIAMMLGPVLMMMPNSGQSRLASLREKAALMGLRVSMAKSAGADKPDIAVYTLPWQKPPQHSLGHSDSLVLLKQHFAHGLHFHQYWDYENREKPPKLNRHQCSLISDYLDQLPEEIRGLAITPEGVALYWTERLAGYNTDREKLEKIDGLLKSLADVLQKQP